MAVWVAVGYMLRVVNPEFPSDNHELWSARPPPWEGEAETETAAASEAETEPETGTEAASEAETEPEAEPVTGGEAEAESASEPEAVTVTAEEDIPVEVAEFEDADFAMAEEESLPPPAKTDAFQRFVSALVEVALAAGAAAGVAGAIPGMVGAARLDVRALDGETLEALVAANLLSRTGSGAVARSAGLVSNAQAWRATLLGEETELPVTEMLDEWSATLVAAVANLPQQREALRRELRARGIAAFGMLDAA